MMHPKAHALQERLANVAAPSPANVMGRVVEAVGTLVKVTGLSARMGDVCALRGLASDFHLYAEVVGFQDDNVLLAPMGEMQGLSTHVSVVSIGRPHEILVGDYLLGQVVDGMGTPILKPDTCNGAAMIPVSAMPPQAMERRQITTPLSVGVRAIDAFLSCGVGQRLGIFAPAGCGKSTLLGMIARNATADVNVIALIGERGREVQEFISDSLGDEGMKRSILVVATSDRPALERARAAMVATAIAEHYRNQGKSVLLLLDSVTRCARALREIGLAAGEPPTRRAFPPSVFSSLPRLFERAGQSSNGAITAFYTVLEETDDGNDPISEEVRSLLDGHIILSRKLAEKGHFPAIDVLGSVSRVMSRIVSDKHIKTASAARELLSNYQELELLIRMGEYKRGTDQVADAAVNANPMLVEFLKQDLHEASSFALAIDRLHGIVTK